MMLYELMRTYGDRILMPSHRASLVNRVLDSCKQEFVAGGHITPAYIDEMLLGNYHERRQGAHLKYLYMNSESKQVKDEIRLKVRKCSNNHFLESFLDAPNGLKEIFRLSRVLFKEMQHAIVVGQSGKHEYLQLAAILNDALILELNCEKYGQPLKFAQVFKQAVVSAVALNTLTYIVVDDQQLRDPLYVDYVYHFITSGLSSILLDADFKQALVDVEQEASAAAGKRTMQNTDVLLLQASRKI